MTAILVFLAIGLVAAVAIASDPFTRTEDSARAERAKRAAGRGEPIPREEVSPRHCARCGASIEVGARFCPSCGAATAGGQPPQQSQGASGGMGCLAVTGVTALVILAAVAVVVFLVILYAFQPSP